MFPVQTAISVTAAHPSTNRPTSSERAAVRSGGQENSRLHPRPTGPSLVANPLGVNNRTNKRHAATLAKAARGTKLLTSFFPTTSRRVPVPDSVAQEQISAQRVAGRIITNQLHALWTQCRFTDTQQAHFTHQIYMSLFQKSKGGILADKKLPSIACLRDAMTDAELARIAKVEQALVKWLEQANAARRCTDYDAYLLVLKSECRHLSS
jgi:hypothetical protein